LHLFACEWLSIKFTFDHKCEIIFLFESSIIFQMISLPPLKLEYICFRLQENLENYERMFSRDPTRLERNEK